MISDRDEEAEKAREFFEQMVKGGLRAAGVPLLAIKELVEHCGPEWFTVALLGARLHTLCRQQDEIIALLKKLAAEKE
jgi:hypothetical protein